MGCDYYVKLIPGSPEMPHYSCYRCGQPVTSWSLTKGTHGDCVNENDELEVSRTLPESWRAR